MKIYWDSSALLEALGDDAVRRRLNQSGGVTRTHALAEVFSTITGGGVGLRVTADAAAQLIQQLADNLEFCDLTETEILHAFAHAKASVRASVEHPCHILKNIFRHRKVRYRGLAKNGHQLYTLFGLANVVIGARPATT